MFPRISGRCPLYCIITMLSKEHQERWGHSGGAASTGSSTCETNQLKGLQTSWTAVVQFVVLGGSVIWCSMVLGSEVKVVVT